MWPRNKGEALSHTLAAEQAITDLYSEALRLWVPQIIDDVLPTFVQRLAASGASYNGDPHSQPDLPPNPDAIESAGPWDQLSELLILSGLATIWAISLSQTLKALGNDLPGASPGESREAIPAEVMRAVSAATALPASEIRDIEAAVTAHPAYRAQRDDMIAAQRQFVADTPMLVRRKVDAAIAEELHQAALRSETSEQARVSVRLAVSQTISPASMDMRDVARDQGYQAAGVQNHAVLAAASGFADSETLEKVWIATMDGRTRDTHFAADGQRAPLAGKFTVGGVQLDRPGDPTGPAREVRNCRCRVGVLAHDEPLPDEVDRHTERLDGRDATARNREGTQRDEIDRRADRGVIRARDDEQDGLGRTAAGGPNMAPKPGQNRPVTAAVGDVMQDGSVIVAEGFVGDDGTVVVTDSDEPNGEMFRTFTDQPVALIGSATSDGRIIASDVDMSFRDMPLPLMWMKTTGSGFGGHTEAFTVGVIETAALGDGTINASGYLLNTPEADECANEIAHGVTAPSVDLAATEWKLTDENGKEISEDEWWDLPLDAQIFQTITKAELIGTTLVATPAFGETRMELDADRQSRNVAVVASAAEQFRPRVYPARFFADPKLGEPTLPTMDDDGRIFGHLACFGACHRSIQSQCVMAPRSRSNYSHFHTSPAVRLDDGTAVPVGRLTVGTGHPSDRLSGPAAQAHYDNTGACFALVRVGEDAHGIWFSGVAHPAATAEQIEAGITAPLSGDWRDFGQGLELVAALAVNTPGFAARGRDDHDGRPVTLVASLGPSPRDTPAGQAMTVDDIRAAVLSAMDERDKASRTAALLARAEQTVGRPPTPRERVLAALRSR